MSIASYFESGEQLKNKGHFKNLVLLADADGEIDDKELVLLYKIGRRIGLSNKEIGEIMDEPKKYAVIPPFGKDERFEMMIDLVRMVMADGKVADEETRLLANFAVKIGYKTIDDVDVESITALIERGEDNDTILTELSF